MILPLHGLGSRQDLPLPFAFVLFGAALALVVWVPVALAAHRHPEEEQVPEDVSHALPWASATAWLVAAFLTAQSCQFYSALAWLAPTYESYGWTAREAGLLMAVFTGAQLVSGLGAPTLLDRVPDARVLLVLAGLLGGTGELGVWLAPAPGRGRRSHSGWPCSCGTRRPRATAPASRPWSSSSATPWRRSARP